MDFYKNNSFAKTSIATLGLVIVVTTMIYSQYLARQLKAREEATMDLVTQAISIVASPDNPNLDNTMMENLILEEFNGLLPTILEDESGELLGYNYWKESLNNDQEFLATRRQKLLDEGFEPIKGFGNSNYIYYEHSRLYTLISLFPLAQILLISTFIILGYVVLAASRRAEENRIWAGMAKETAHQLGTPTSAILGWIEHLKDISQNNPEYEEIITELKNDVDRLDLIADRFSKIGSRPDLHRIDLVTELESCKNYMQKRASKRVDFEFAEQSQDAVYCNINSHLFDWVIENILRNALDALQGNGKITVELENTPNKVHVNISDTGKGIPSSDFKNIFKPGFTTKKRGWGLGLSLAKRIIENYHKGKIYVKSSKPNEGTTITIELPLA
ncbi:MAG: sensor histidine kinase [Saprospiraceae bacterium]